MRKIYILIMILNLSASVFCLDISDFTGYLGVYKSVKAEKIEWKLFSEYNQCDKHELFELKDQGVPLFFEMRFSGYRPGDLIIKQDSFPDGEVINFSHDGSFLLNLDDSNLFIFDEEKREIVITESIGTDTIRFISDTQIEIIIEIENDLVPGGVRLYKRILYQKSL